MADDFLAWIVGVCEGVVRLFPVADPKPFADAVAPLGRVIAWISALNEGFPVVELLGAVGIVLGVYGSLYLVMLVRRVFSLIWPGAGS